MRYGLNLWDTAAVYGEGSSERILGNFIKDLPRDQVIISTKFTPQIAGTSPNAMQTMLNGSKVRLHTDYIDIYWIHNQFNVEKWTPELIPLARSGQILSIGLSNHNLKELQQAEKILAAAGLRISAVQNHYSLLHRSSEHAGILEYCRQKGMTFYSYMVLEQGALTGKYHRNHPFPKDSARATVYNRHLSELETLLEEMRRIAASHNATIAQTATAWALAKGTLPIIGVTSVKHVEEVAHAAELRLTPQEILHMEELGEKADISTLREWEREML